MFRYHSALNGVDQRMRFKEGAIANGVTINPGETARLVNGRWELADTSETVDGVMEGTSAKTGNAAGTVKGYFRLTRDSEFEVPQGAIADAACEPGDLLDIGADRLSVAAAVNNDLKVTRRDVARNLLYVEFLNRGI